MEASTQAIFDAARSINADVSMLSWGGFNIAGDRKSIQEVAALTSIESMCRALRERIREQQGIIEHQRQEIGKLHARIAVLDSFIPGSSECGP